MRSLIAVGTLLPIILAIPPRIAYAHAFGDRYDLPVPLWLYLLGAGSAVALSFVVVGLFVKGTPHLHTYPRYNLLRLRWFRLTLANPWLLRLLQAISVAVFLLVISSGLWGTQKALENFAPTFVWIIWWVGLSFFTALIGNLWALVNPWKVLFQWFEWPFAKLTGGEEISWNHPYPQRLGVWPAFLLFLVFVWVEDAFPNPAKPYNIAVMAVFYSLITWGGMLVFGKDTWLRYGEAFSVFFRLLARFAPTEVRCTDQAHCQQCSLHCLQESPDCVNCYQCFTRSADRELNLRPPAIGLIHGEALALDTVAFVLLMLVGVTFDGFNDTPKWVSIQNLFYPLLAPLGPYAFPVLDTLGLLAFLSIFLLSYRAFSHLIRRFSRNAIDVNLVMRAFVFSLIPIAFAYQVAHFSSFLLIQGQLLIPLLSDPFGYGWNLLGTAKYTINIAIINAKIAWFVGVGAIVLGHIVAVFLSHLLSLRLIANHRDAVRSQYPMLALMVGYTVTSLWIIAQPLVK